MTMLIHHSVDRLIDVEDVVSGLDQLLPNRTLLVTEDYFPYLLSKKMETIEKLPKKSDEIRKRFISSVKASVEREQLYAGRGKKFLIKDVEGLFSVNVVITGRYVRVDFSNAATTSEFVLEVEAAFETLINGTFTRVDP